MRRFSVSNSSEAPTDGFTSSLFNLFCGSSNEPSETTPEKIETIEKPRTRGRETRPTKRVPKPAPYYLACPRR